MLLNVSVSTLEDLSFVSAEETIADLNDFEEFDFDIGKLIISVVEFINSIN